MLRYQNDYFVPEECGERACSTCPHCDNCIIQLKMKLQAAQLRQRLKAELAIELQKNSHGFTSPSEKIVYLERPDFKIEDE